MKTASRTNEMKEKQTKRPKVFQFAATSFPSFSSVSKSFLSSFLFIAFIGALTSCSTPRNSRPIREADYPAPIRVACVGDSITWGYGIKDREHNCYPAQLASLLGKKWDVRNFGVNGATALRKGTRPYNKQQAFRDALAFEPDVVVIKLGTNDTNAKSWPAHKGEFLSDYLELIRSFQNLKTKPRIFLCRPVPLFRDRGKEYDTDKILVEEVIPKINEAARKTKLPLIDLYAPFEGKSNLFPDGVHPDAEGAGIMAREIYAKLLGHRIALGSEQISGELKIVTSALTPALSPKEREQRSPRLVIRGPQYYSNAGYVFSLSSGVRASIYPIFL